MELFCMSQIAGYDVIRQMRKTIEDLQNRVKYLEHQYLLNTLSSHGSTSGKHPKPLKACVLSLS